MKISELIPQLQTALDIHGDVDVVTHVNGKYRPLRTAFFWSTLFVLTDRSMSDTINIEVADTISLGESVG